MKQFIFPIILIAAAVFLYYLFISPTYAQVQTLKAERAEYNEALANADQLRNKISSLRQKLNSFPPEQMDRLDTMLPDNGVDNVRFVLELDNATSEQEMELQNITVSEGDGNRRNRNEEDETGAQVKATVAEFTTEGTYENLLALLSSLERSLRIVDVQSVEFRGGSKKPDGTSSDEYRYRITVQTYWLKY